MTPAISFERVCKVYPQGSGSLHALDHVELDIAPGEFFGLLGPNGAGKTTLISILAGLAHPSSGRVLVQGCDVQADSTGARRRLGVVPQELVFDPFFSVREALRLQSGYFGIRSNGAWIDELLHSLGLEDKANANMRQLSGGMKRRVLVALALVHRPPIIVLDEPTAGVDVELRQTLWHFIARLNREGHTVLLTTHYLEEAEALCTRVAMLRQGRVVKLASMSEMLQAASSNVLQFKTDAPLPQELAARARDRAHCADSGARCARCRAPARRAAPKRRADAGCGNPPRRPGRRFCPGHAGAAGGRSMKGGWLSLLEKEVLRFWKVGFQTVAAPVLTAVLYLLIFGHVLEGRMLVYERISYTAFLIPGLVMMSILQNAFANSSSSLVQGKIMGSLVFVLLSPLSHLAWFAAYVGASVLRGLMVGVGVFLITLFFAVPEFAAPGWIFAFAFLGAALLGTLGVIAGLWADKFDQMAAFQNFLIMPMTFLSGVFYSIQSLPPFWQAVSHLNPFFYMIDGFRHGFFGQGDVSPWISLIIVAGAWLLVSALALRLLRTGYKIRG